MKCKHERTTDGDPRCFSGSVAVEPYTTEHRAAHGNIVVIETCDDCGAQRHANRNGRHVEVGPWGPDAATTEEQERRDASEQRQRQRDEDWALLEEHGITQVKRRGDVIAVRKDGREQTIFACDCEAAATPMVSSRGIVAERDIVHEVYAAILRRC